MKIQSLSRFMSIACTLSIGIIPLVTVWYWTAFESNLPLIQAKYSGTLFSMEYISSWQIVAGAVVSLFGCCLLIMALWQLRSFFNLTSNGEYFSQRTTMHLSRFANILFLCAIFKPISVMLYSVILTWKNPPGSRSLILDFGSQDLLTILMACTFLIIMWIFKEGARISKENASFI